MPVGWPWEELPSGRRVVGETKSEAGRCLRALPAFTERGLLFWSHFVPRQPVVAACSGGSAS